MTLKYDGLDNKRLIFSDIVTGEVYRLHQNQSHTIMNIVYNGMVSGDWYVNGSNDIYLINNWNFVTLEESDEE